MTALFVISTLHLQKLCVFRSVFVHKIYYYVRFRNSSAALSVDKDSNRDFKVHLPPNELNIEMKLPVADRDRKSAPCTSFLPRDEFSDDTEESEGSQISNEPLDLDESGPLTRWSII